MKKLALGLAAMGLAVFGLGLTAQAAGSGAPTVDPQSGGPGFSFTVTIEGCTVESDITFSFPPSPPDQVVPCAASGAPASTTTEAPATTEEPTETTEAPEECEEPRLQSLRGQQISEDCPEPCIPVQGIGHVQGEVDFCEEPEVLQNLRQVIVPSQVTGSGTASATFTAPTTPGTYSGTVSSAAGTQSFSITVVSQALPATGASDQSGAIFAIAVLLVVAGGALFIVAQARRPEHSAD